jgi:hypothetical protein
VDDFSSPKDLAKTLETLSDNATAYNEYFWWQQFYKLVTQSHMSMLRKLFVCYFL